MLRERRTTKAWLIDGDNAIEADALTNLLDQAFLTGPDRGDAQRALARVSKSLVASRGETFFYDVLPSTPLGPLFVAMSDQGVTALGFDDDEEQFVARLQKRHHAHLERSPSHVASAAVQLQEYFNGMRDHFNLALDLRSLTPFQRAVLSAIQQVQPGETISYGSLARRIGKPGSARAVGRALGSNPIPIIIPCHRALSADGSLGGYSGRGGVRTKRTLLELEGALP
jgi:methylated-DNA-[protein]-cysteine S-methyltransferase